MNSERLPGKIMQTIGGKPMIGILIDRLRDSGIPIIIATSTNSENDQLVAYAHENGINIFRGSEDNVLERFYQAAKLVKANTIIRLTGDNPLMDGGLIAEALDYYFKQDFSRVYLSTGLSQSFPLGISAEIFSFELLEEAFNKAEIPGEFEHVTPYMHQNRPGDIKIIPYSGAMKKYHYRLSVDTESDFRLISTLVEDYGCDKKTIVEIVEVLDKHPELQLINNTVAQKLWDQ